VTSGSQNFRIFAGDSATLDVAITNPDGTEFNPAEAGNYVWIMTRDPSNYDAAAIIKVLGDGISTISGGVSITLSPTDTDVAPGPYAHLLRVWDGPDVAVVMVGTAIIRPAAVMTAPPEMMQSPQHARRIALEASV
jgi:hypothetical protein